MIILKKKPSSNYMQRLKLGFLAMSINAVVLAREDIRQLEDDTDYDSLASSDESKQMVSSVLVAVSIFLIIVIIAFLIYFFKMRQ